MAIVLTQEEMDRLRVLRDEAPSQGYWHVYEYIAGVLEARGVMARGQ